MLTIFNIGDKAVNKTNEVYGAHILVMRVVPFLESLHGLGFLICRVCVRPGMSSVLPSWMLLPLPPFSLFLDFDTFSQLPFMSPQAGLVAPLC